MPYLIDTDILIYSLKNNAIVNNNFRAHEHHPKAVSVISYGELLIGARRSVHIEKNLAVIYRIRELFPIVPIDQSVIETFSIVKSALLGRGSILDDMDMLIASTALTLNYILVTNNEKHFKRVPGLLFENWSKE